MITWSLGQAGAEARLFVVGVVGIVGVVASRLRQAAADQVRDGQEYDVEPGAVGAELVGVVVVGLHDVGGDQHADDCGDIGAIPVTGPPMPAVACRYRPHR